MTAVASLAMPDPQVFIGRARKARDAWTASFVFADLMRIGLAQLHDGGGLMLQPWFDPGGAALPLRAALPNKAVAAFPNADAATAALARAETAMVGEFRSLTARVHQFLTRLGVVPDPQLWDTQATTFPEVLWVVADDQDGGVARQRAEALAKARKGIRDRVRLSPERIGRDVSGCTLCGCRQAVVPAGDAPGSLARRLPRDVRRAEALCTICLVVRFAFSSGHFQRAGGFRVRSVSEVAAGPWMGRVDLGSPAVRQFVETAAEVGWCDGAASLANATEAVYGVDPPDAASNDDLGLVAIARDELFEAVGAAPARRYALVAFDGDRMGEHFRSLLTAEERLASSRALAAFATSEAPAAVESTLGLGQLLYAGGDDGRFLAPAGRVLHIVRELRQRLATTLPGLTLSAGIAVADVQHPLDLVIDSAVKSLDVAKERYGRDAFAVVWLTGGGHRLAGGRFVDAAGSDLVEGLARVAADFANQSLSRSLPTTVQALAEKFDDSQGQDPVFADLARERLLVATAGAVGSMPVVSRWLDTLAPGRAAGLMRLARDLATVTPG